MNDHPIPADDDLSYEDFDDVWVEPSDDLEVIDLDALEEASSGDAVSPEGEVSSDGVPLDGGSTEPDALTATLLEPVAALLVGLHDLK